MKRILSKINLDTFGIWISSACAVHCLLLPVLLPVLSILGLKFLANENIEKFIIFTSIAIATYSFVFSYVKNHGKIYPFFLIILAIIFFTSRENMGESYEPWVNLLAGGLIVIYHIVNIRLCKRCPKCKD